MKQEAHYLKVVNSSQKLKTIFNKVKFLTDENIDDIITFGRDYCPNDVVVNYDDIEISFNILNAIVITNGNIELENKIDFSGDSLFCEWCWLIDFDKETLEVYKGFNKTTLTKNDRFYNIKQSSDKYYQIKLFNSWEFKDILTIENKDFIDECQS